MPGGVGRLAGGCRPAAPQLARVRAFPLSLYSLLLTPLPPLSLAILTPCLLLTRSFASVLERFVGLCTTSHGGPGSKTAGKGYLRAVSILLDGGDGRTEIASGAIAGAAGASKDDDINGAAPVSKNNAKTTEAFVEFASTKLIPFLHANLEDRK